MKWRKWFYVALTGQKIMLWAEPLRQKSEICLDGGEMIGCNDWAVRYLGHDPGTDDILLCKEKGNNEAQEVTLKELLQCWKMLPPRIFQLNELYVPLFYP